MPYKKIIRNSVFAIFLDESALNKAVDMLKSQNFRSQDISVLMPSGEDSKEFAFKKHTKAPEGATTGAASGAVAGGLFGWLVGAGVLSIPGFGPFIAAGPIMAAIAGAGVGGTIGGLAGGFIGLGIPENEAQKYEAYMNEGAMFISVHVDDEKWETKAKEILEENGALNVSSTNEKKSNEIPHYVSEVEKEFDEKRGNFHE